VNVAGGPCPAEGTKEVSQYRLEEANIIGGTIDTVMLLVGSVIEHVQHKYESYDIA
jgi:hypothetical protein